jgi:hypothetical protein
MHQNHKTQMLQLFLLNRTLDLQKKRANRNESLDEKKHKTEEKT